MIRYTQHMNVSAEEFFNTMSEQVARDINQQTGRQLDAAKLQTGCKFKVKKTRGNKTIESIVEVRRPIINRKFETVYTSGSKSYIMGYEIEEIDDKNINVTYIQDDGKETQGLLTKWKAISTTKKRLKAFEKFIKEQRNEKA